MARKALGAVSSALGAWHGISDGACVQAAGQGLLDTLAMAGVKAWDRLAQ